MSKSSDLLLALDMLTAGDQGENVPESLSSEAVATKKDHKSWVAAAGIQGFGIAEKVTDSKRLTDVVLKIYVEKKKPISKLRDSVKIPESISLPSLGGTIATDVEEIGKLVKESNTSRVRPAIPGFSVGHPDVTAGTLGCLVRKVGVPGTVYILSNSHVLANEGVATIGDKILQPGVADFGASPADIIGELSEFVPFHFSTDQFDNLVDAAIAKVKRSDVVPAIRLIGVPLGTATVRRGTQVQKTGRTTDHTIGIVRDVNYRTAIKYKKPGGGKGRVGFRDQVLCSRYTAGGDSGSAVLNMSGKVVGLHFSGSPTTSVFSPISFVLSALGIELVT